MRTVIKKEKGFVGFFLLIILIAVVLVGGFYFVKSKEQKPLIKPEIKVQPTPTPSPWATYINSKYNFSLTYPKLGVIHGENEYFEGECGKEIKEQPNVIIFDNLAEIQIVSWDGSLDDYLVSKGAFGQYDLSPVASSSAYQLIEVIGLKKGAEYAVGYPPLVYINYIYKRDTNVFLIRIPPTHNNIGGCVNPNLVDPVKYSKYKDQGWDFKKNFTFLEIDKSKNGNFCGGLTGKLCSSGYTCKLDGNYPDAGGKCVKE